MWMRGIRGDQNDRVTMQASVRRMSCGLGKACNIMRHLNAVPPSKLDAGLPGIELGAHACSDAPAQLSALGSLSARCSQWVCVCMLGPATLVGPKTRRPL